MKILKFVGILVAALLVGAGGFYGWARSAVAEKLAQTYDTHSIDVPVPIPLSDSEIEALRKERSAPPAEGEAPAVPDTGAQADPLEGVDLAAIALERARARGKHLVEARYVCVECHGKNLAGGVMVDDPALGRLLGPNLTAGAGSRTQGFTFADWDRIVRHGVRRDGKPAVMPSEDFVNMSDRELSDVIAYVQTFPAVDNEVPAPEFGPLGSVLAALGKLPLSADVIRDHHAEHKAEAPPEDDTPEFGGHLAQICVGCHGHALAGGPIPVGPPEWPPAANLTSHASSPLASWSFEDFDAVMRTGKRPDGSAVKEPMTLVVPYAANMKPVEMKALWTYLRSLPPLPVGGH